MSWISRKNAADASGGPGISLTRCWLEPSMGTAEEAPYKLHSFVANVGRKVERSKKRALWVFAFGQCTDHHEVIFEHSAVSGKKRVYVDGNLIAEARKRAAAGWSHSWRMGKRVCRVTVTEDGSALTLILNLVVGKRVCRVTVTEDGRYEFTVDDRPFCDWPDADAVAASTPQRQQAYDKAWGARLRALSPAPLPSTAASSASPLSTAATAFSLSAATRGAPALSTLVSPLSPSVCDALSIVGSPMSAAADAEPCWPDAPGSPLSAAGWLQPSKSFAVRSGANLKAAAAAAAELQRAKSVKAPKRMAAAAKAEVMDWLSMDMPGSNNASHGSSAAAGRSAHGLPPPPPQQQQQQAFSTVIPGGVSSDSAQSPQQQQQQMMMMSAAASGLGPENQWQQHQQQQHYQQLPLAQWEAQPAGSSAHGQQQQQQQQQFAPMMPPQQQLPMYYGGRHQHAFIPTNTVAAPETMVSAAATGPIAPLPQSDARGGTAAGHEQDGMWRMAAHFNSFQLQDSPPCGGGGAHDAAAADAQCTLRELARRGSSDSAASSQQSAAMLPPPPLLLPAAPLLLPSVAGSDSGSIEHLMHFDLSRRSSVQSAASGSSGSSSSSSCAQLAYAGQQQSWHASAEAAPQTQMPQWLPALAPMGLAFDSAMSSSSAQWCPMPAALPPHAPFAATGGSAALRGSGGGCMSVDSPFFLSSEAALYTQSLALPKQPQYKEQQQLLPLFDMPQQRRALQPIGA
ncbi:hypothetical protein JKP88DRAFT_311087 [Tribonema minus]|uniref:Uncharacterized protein n=1 Tax=Tribonema minus TaxID=303371 RepID=A0A836CHW5_9STRA|nr:hypothetical protein JKP88DRAFT_311087 [Tribonema minus]